MEQPRNCVEVIDEIQKHVPEEQKQLIVALENARIDASFKPPEETIQWERLHRVLLTHLGGVPTEEWQFKVWSIFTTITVEQIKERVNSSKN